ncbi:Lrp/AsnC ligand binding domain-containing protein [Candidatus Bathyarchaeota archaeon]|jgi:DNA-binding Lrp family transcriptional regulator|nr:Lrp/AsnC ligand binding domain-containing protein [Candidatus Bathyarchaeota archaeon]
MVEAIVLMNFLGGTAQNMEWYKSVKKQLLGIPGVVEVFGVLGGYDMVARIRAKDLDELTTIVTDKLRSNPGVESSQTLIVIF